MGWDFPVESPQRNVLKLNMSHFFTICSTSWPNIYKMPTYIIKLWYNTWNTSLDLFCAPAHVIFNNQPCVENTLKITVAVAQTYTSSVTKKKPTGLNLLFRLKYVGRIWWLCICKRKPDNLESCNVFFFLEQMKHISLVVNTDLSDYVVPIHILCTVKYKYHIRKSGKIKIDAY